MPNLGRVHLVTLGGIKVRSGLEQPGTELQLTDPSACARKALDLPVAEKEWR
jgi:hypothetical protein